MRYDDAERWIRGVARGEIHLDVTPALTSASQGSVAVSSNPLRGW
jgi:phage gp36-like protein